MRDFRDNKEPKFPGGAAGSTAVPLTQTESTKEGRSFGGNKFSLKRIGLMLVGPASGENQESLEYKRITAYTLGSENST